MSTLVSIFVPLELITTCVHRSYDSATPSDLWRGLQEALDQSESIINIPEGETVETIMETWNSQSGYPVVYVERNYSTGVINVSQVN